MIIMHARLSCFVLTGSYYWVTTWYYVSGSDPVQLLELSLSLSIAAYSYCLYLIIHDTGSLSDPFSIRVINSPSSYIL